jgi:hypothetical protein
MLGSEEIRQLKMILPENIAASGSGEVSHIDTEVYQSGHNGADSKSYHLYVPSEPRNP